MKKISKVKKIGVLVVALTFMFSIYGASSNASAFSITKYNMTLSGGNSIAKRTGSAWGNISPQSYVSVASVYKYKDGSEIVVNDGNTFIQIQPLNQALTIE